MATTSNITSIPSISTNANREIIRAANQPIRQVTGIVNKEIRNAQRQINAPIQGVTRTVTGEIYKVSRTATSILSGTIRKTLKDLNVGLTNSQINQITNTVVGPINKQISSITRNTTNGLLKSIPKINLGIVNPVNLTTGNFSPQKLAGTINHELKKYTNPQLVNNTVTSLKSELINTLPKNSNFNVLEIDKKFKELNVSSLLDDAIGVEVDSELVSYADELLNFNSDAIPASVIPGDIDSYFSDDVEQSLEKVQEVYNQSQVSQYLQESEQFLNSEDYTKNNEDKLITLEKGFVDPSANLPNDSYSGKSEVNKLAQGEAAGTVVARKNYERMKGAKLPGGEAWDQPLSPFKGEYPYNKVTQTESGHIFEIDDTPGSERIHNFHRTGTFEEIDNTGSKVTRIVGSSYTIIDQNGKVYIAGKADVSISGNCNIYVGNDANIEVDGDTNLTCHNDITAMAGGKMNLSAVEEINVTSNKIFMEAYSDFNIKTGNILNVYSGDKINVLANKQYNLQANVLMNVKSLDTLKIYSSKFYNYSADYYNQVTSSFHFKGGSSFNVDSDLIYLNSGTAQESQQADNADKALISNIGIMAGRKPSILVIKDDPSPLGQGDKLSLLLDEPIPDTKEGNLAKQEARSRAILTGACTAEQYDSAPVDLESKTPSSINSTIILCDESLRQRKELPGNFKLSEHFTVEMLSSKAKVSSYIITADPSRSLTYGDIICNLQSLALNILDPVYKLYPKMIVTSAYRSPKADCNSPTSQHPLGKAADIQFTGLPWEKYYDIAIELSKVLNFDQLLLEYCATANNPWIHISFDGNQNRKQLMTFWNHRRHSFALNNLSKNTA